LEDDLGDQIRITHSYAGWSNRPFMVVQHEVDPTTNTVTLTAYDVQTVLDDYASALLPTELPFLLA
jgi:hypothetical protein